MTPHEVAWVVFGAGIGSLATMFVMAYRHVRDLEERDGA